MKHPTCEQCGQSVYMLAIPPTATVHVLLWCVVVMKRKRDGKRRLCQTCFLSDGAAQHMRLAAVNKEAPESDEN